MEKAKKSFISSLNPYQTRGGYVRYVPPDERRHAVEKQQPYKRSTSGGAYDFGETYRKYRNKEWVPRTMARHEPPVMIHPTEFYYNFMGMVPNYGGHIPGAIFRCGKTYGKDTQDTKRWLRGDFSE